MAALHVLAAMLAAGCAPEAPPAPRPGEPRVAPTAARPAGDVPMVHKGLRGPPAPGQEVDPSRIPLPTHPLANEVERLLLELARTGDRDYLERAWGVLAAEPDIQRQAYPLMLRTYLAELREPGSGESVLATMRPEVRATWEYYFRRELRELVPYLECGALSNCLLEMSRAGKPHPDMDRFLDRSWDNRQEAVEITCGELVVDTASCPKDYGTFDRVRWVTQGEERLSHWAPLGASAKTFAEFSRLIGVSPGLTVADIGAGLGVFAFPFAEAVGPEGRVYAVEIEEQLVDFMRWRKEQGGFDSLEVVLSTPDDLGLEPGTVDVAVLCQMMAKDLLELDSTGVEVDHFGPFVESVKRSLKPDGVVVIIDHCVERVEEGDSCAPIVQRKLTEHGLEQKQVIRDFMPVQLVEVYGINR